MSITNIGSLQTSVESWLERTFDDALFLEWANAVADELTNGSMAPDGRTWIVPPLRCRAMLDTDTLTTSGAQATLPTDWLEFERVWIDANDGRDLLYVPLKQFRTDADTQLTGTPQKYTIDGRLIYIAPTSDADIEISYYKALGAFVGDASTDVILTANPRVYLAGVISEANGWIKDYEQQAAERAKFAAAVRGINATFRQAQAGGSLLVMRPQSVS